MDADALSRQDTGFSPFVSATTGVGWDALAASVLPAGGVVMALGPTDSGKSSFLFWWACTAARQGLRVWMVDADVGQSDVGPPCAISAALVSAEMAAAPESFKPARALPAEVMYFVGSTSPREHLRAMITGTAAAVKAVRARGADLILVDTTGYVGDETAMRLKQAKIDAVAPDLLLICGVSDALDRIVAPYRSREVPRIATVAPGTGLRTRSAALREEARAACWGVYFEGAKVRRLPLDILRHAPHQGRCTPQDRLVGRVVGLFIADGTCVALGTVLGCRRGRLEVLTPLPSSVRVARLDVGDADLSAVCLR